MLMKGDIVDRMKVASLLAEKVMGWKVKMRYNKASYFSYNDGGAESYKGHVVNFRPLHYDTSLIQVLDKLKQDGHIVKKRKEDGLYVFILLYKKDGDMIKYIGRSPNPIYAARQMLESFTSSELVGKYRQA